MQTREFTPLPADFTTARLGHQSIAKSCSFTVNAKEYITIKWKLFCDPSENKQK